VREPPFSVGKAQCIAKAQASAMATRGGAGTIGFAQGCPVFIARGALEHTVTSAQQSSGVDVCCYFSAPPPP
jgi:hypothetical protein